MPLSAETVHTSATVDVRFVHCRPHDRVCGPIEHTTKPLVVLPLRGLFVKHHGQRGIVADGCHALFFNADEPYRVSHPVDGGDECLVIDPAPAVLLDMQTTLDARASDRPEHAFRRTDVPLDARLIATRRVLSHRLRQRVASTLEAEETALHLLAATVRAAAARPAAARGRWARTRTRHEDMIAATKLTLASRPAEAWALTDLAARIHSSPFHLARTFHQLAGMPLHRYHLRARMARALDDVLDSDRDLTTIGVALGFSSHSHFTVTFRKMFGVAPSFLRQHARGRSIAELRKILTAR
jgi:AraC family transcriptional regulator